MRSHTLVEIKGFLKGPDNIQGPPDILERFSILKDKKSVLIYMADPVFFHENLKILRCAFKA